MTPFYQNKWFFFLFFFLNVPFSSRIPSMSKAGYCVKVETVQYFKLNTLSGDL